MLSPEEFRELFLLDPEVVFLNHGSFGAVPRPVFEEQERLRKELEAEPVLFLARRLEERLASARQVVGSLVRADPDDLALVPNTTTALNAVALSLDLEPGDEIVTTTHEYGAMRILWDEVSRLTGATVRPAVLPEPAASADDVVAAVGAALGERTRVLFCSHITSLSAAVLPVARLCAEARSRGIVSVVDGAHAPGQLDLDLDAVGADVYAGNLHKWAFSPRGSAFVHVRPELQERIRGPVVSWNWTWDGPDAFRGRFGWPGTVDPTSYLAAPAGLAFQREHDWPSVVAACRERLEHTITALADTLDGIPAAAPELRAPQFASIHLDLGGREPDDVQRALWDGYRIEVPVERIGSLTVVRPSVQAYVTDDDCRALVDALVEILRR